MVYHCLLQSVFDGFALRESAFSVCKVVLCRNKIVQGHLGPLRAEYPSLHAPRLFNLVSQRLQDNITL